jgi:FkbM family methyltransferase
MSEWRGIKWYLELCGLRGVVVVAFSRLLGTPRELTVFPFRRPIHLRIDTSDFCAYRDVLIFQTKQYLPEMKGFAPQTIIDAGAHIGMSTILFAQNYPKAKIFALEPEPSNYDALRRNTGPYKNVVCIRAALWREDGEVMLSPSTAHPKGAFAIAERDGIKVPAVTMSTLMKEAQLTSIDLLKMDIEGAEKDVFRNCPWVSSVQVLAIELHDRMDSRCSEVVHSAMRNRYCARKGEISFFYKNSNEAGTS